MVSVVTMSDGNAIREKLEQRHKERVEIMDQRRAARAKEKLASGESAILFLEDFNRSKREISSALNTLDCNIPKTELTSEFDRISKKVQTLQKFVSDSALYLPSYDMRRAQEISAQMRSDVAKRRDELLPKKKFAFKSRQKLRTNTHTAVSAAENEQKLKVDEEEDMNNILKNVVGFSDRAGETLTLGPEECSGKDISLSNLADCTVYIQGDPSAVRVKNMVNTEVYCGPVSRSVFVSDCLDCLLHVACQQLRIHSTISTKFFIHVTSKAIIEDCEDVGFAKFSWTYPLLVEHFTAAGLDAERNNWRDVDDFNWLKLDEKSPNWYIIE